MSPELTFEEKWNLPENVVARKNRITLLANINRTLTPVEELVIGIAASKVNGRKLQTVFEGLKYIQDQSYVRGIILHNVWIDYAEFVPITDNGVKKWRESKTKRELEEFLMAEAIKETAKKLIAENAGVNISLDKDGKIITFKDEQQLQKGESCQ